MAAVPERAALAVQPTGAALGARFEGADLGRADG